jgi:hypothetical protein
MLAKNIVLQWESNNLDEEPETSPKKVKEESCTPKSGQFAKNYFHTLSSLL